MPAHRSHLSAWTRRDFIRTGIATAGAVALGACARTGAPPASVSTGVGSRPRRARPTYSWAFPAGRVSSLRRRQEGMEPRLRSPPSRDGALRWHRRRATLRGVCAATQHSRRDPRRRAQLCRIRSGRWCAADRSRRVQHRHRRSGPPSRVGRRRHENQGVAHRNPGCGTPHADGRVRRRRRSGARARWRRHVSEGAIRDGVRQRDRCTDS